MSLVAVRDLWTDPQVVAGRLKRVRNEQWGKGRRWQVRWRDADQVQRKRNFATQDAAEAFWATLQLAPQERATRRTVAEQYAVWIESKGVRRPVTIKGYQLQWEKRVEPAFGHRALSSITHAEVAQWLGGLRVSASTVRKSLLVLSGVCQMAVRDGVIPANPCTGVSQPRPGRVPIRALTIDQVRKLADECAPHQLVVWTLALTGIRWGELCALKPSDLDVGRRRLFVSKSLTELDGVVSVSSTKTGRSREVPVPGWLVDELAKVAGEWLFSTSRGGPWRQSSWKRLWRRHRVNGEWVDGAIERAGLQDVRVHDLRHTYASLAIASGADVKVVQRALGHASAAMTLDIYGHLFDRGLDDVAARLNDVSRVALSGH